MRGQSRNERLVIHPWKPLKTNMEPENTSLGKGETSTNPPIVGGSMLAFGGANSGSRIFHPAKKNSPVSWLLRDRSCKNSWSPKYRLGDAMPWCRDRWCRDALWVCWSRPPSSLYERCRKYGGWHDVTYIYIYRPIDMRLEMVFVQWTLNP